MERGAIRRFAIALMLCAMSSLNCAAGVPLYGYEIVHVYPHDPAAFTEGLFYLDGWLYESTGLERASSIRKVQLETGRVVQRIGLPPRYFGEGIVNWGSRLISLTYRSHVGFVRDRGSLRVQRRFTYPGEGWALTQDGAHLIMSDGTAELRLLDPETLQQTGHVRVTLEGRDLPGINELEWVRGEIFANVWPTNWIVRIDPADGHVLGVVDLSGLLDPAEQVPGHTDVLNGIAYDDAGDRLFVTGKHWPKLFQIRLRRSGDAQASLQ